MEEPWFRRAAPLLYWPLRWQGWATLGAMLAVSLPFGLLFVWLVDDQPFVGWTCAVVGALAQLIGWATVFYKLEGNYGS